MDEEYVDKLLVTIKLDRRAVNYWSSINGG